MRLGKHVIFMHDFVYISLATGCWVMKFRGIGEAYGGIGRLYLDIVKEVPASFRERLLWRGWAVYLVAVPVGVGWN